MWSWASEFHEVILLASPFKLTPAMVAAVRNKRNLFAIAFAHVSERDGSQQRIDVQAKRTTQAVGIDLGERVGLARFGRFVACKRIDWANAVGG